MELLIPIEDNIQKLSQEEIERIASEQYNIHLKYPDAKEFSWDYFDETGEQCPFCNKDMYLGLEFGGPWDFENSDGKGGYPLLTEDAIGKGKSYIHQTFEGDYDGYYTVYYRCPHCGQVFYITFDV